jgi:hypothetical protein
VTVYSLHSADEDRDLGTATGLAGFFIDSDEDWRTFRVAGFAPAGGVVPATVEHLQLRVLGNAGDALGAYAVTAVRIAEQPATLTVSGYVLDVPGANDEIGWQRLRDSRLRRTGAWLTLTAAQKEGWLNAVRMHADLSGSVPDESGGRYELDGRIIGEALRGPGGYFGATLDAFGDCLRGGFGVRAPFTLRWTAANTSRAAVGAARFDAILATMRAAAVTVDLS